MKEWELTDADMALAGLDLMKEVIKVPDSKVKKIDDGEAQRMIYRAIAKVAQKKLVEWLLHNYWIDHTDSEEWKKLRKELGIE